LILVLMIKRASCQVCDPLCSPDFWQCCNGNCILKEAVCGTCGKFGGCAPGEECCTPAESPGRYCECVRFPDVCCPQSITNICNVVIDVSELVTVDQWIQLKDYTMWGPVVRLYRSNGKVDENASISLQNLYDAKVAYFFEGYIYPCPKCKITAEEQVRAALDNLPVPVQDNMKIVWIDVEEKDKEHHWFDSPKDNIEFITNMTEAISGYKMFPGIYTRRDNWISITNDSNAFSSWHLWYAHYDGKPNFDDFVPFGGWGIDSVRMKQYSQNVKMHGVNVDLNVRVQ